MDSVSHGDLVIRDRRPLLPFLTTALAVGIFAIDWFTPLGVAVWVLYVVPVAVTVVGHMPAVPLYVATASTAAMVFTFLTDDRGEVTMWLAGINRGCGVIVLWVLAFMVRAIIENRVRAETEEWLSSEQTRLLEQVQGDRPTIDITERALGTLISALNGTIGAAYASDGTEYRLVASVGVSSSDIPAVVRPGEGLVGAAIVSRRVEQVADVAPEALPLRSAFMDTAPAALVIVPLVADHAVEGVLEIGLRAPLPQQGLELLSRVHSGLAVAIRAAAHRARIRQLLGETQQQAEALRLQQEELRVTNEELEEHAKALRASQARLEEQQTELEASNAQLEAQAVELEQQKATLEVAREEADRASRYKSEFLANMSHELRTPLNSTLILARLLAQNKDGRLSEEQVRFAETIHTSGTTLLNLINDILDLSKVEAGAAQVHIQAVALPSVLDTLQRAFEPLAAEKGLTLTIDAAPLMPREIQTDSQRLQQILTNLLSNALKFTDSGGVVLRVRPEARQQIAFEVRDTGPGIPSHQHEVIFEAFRQADGSTHRRHGGTGLGLSISRQLARLLGGDVFLQSTPGSGSTFTLILPVAGPAGQQASDRPAAIAPAPPQKAHATPTRDLTLGAPPFADDRDNRHHPGRLILVVDDDPVFARVLYDTAHGLDFDCVVASTADDGMALARSLSPNAILLDVVLPDGSGLALLDRLKRSPDTRHIPVHIISAGDHTQTALALGAVGAAIKPVRQEELVDAIRRLEATLEQGVRRVLIVEDDTTLRSSLVELLGQLEDVTIHAAGSAREALDQLSASSFDCVILDLHLPDASGFDVLETMSGNERYSFPPVIVYTGQALSQEDEQRLRQYSRSVIVKGARSPERLLAEVTLFLHQVESRLPQAAQRLLKAARERDEVFEGRRILVVEDDIRNVFALTSVFEPLGAVVQIARNGVEALEAIGRQRPDLVLMDIMMPEMDGLTAMRRIREQGPLATLPIIALTAKAMPDDYQECLAAGASDYLAKPLDVDKLVSLCRVWMTRG
jgi:signal transduction histidine kinase/DNA-binding response OmpR family regulator